MMNEFESDIRLLHAAVKEAGQLAAAYLKRGVKIWRKQDGSEVSEADLAVNEFLEKRLRKARPDYGWLSEESRDGEERLTASRVWIIDPIDGTQAFLSGKSDWCLSIALIENGLPILGAVYNPPHEEFFVAYRGGGTTLNGVPLRVRERKTIEGARLIASRSVLRPQNWEEPLPPIEPVWANSIACRLAFLAGSRADAAIAFSPKWEWDIAAGALIAEEAGLRVTDAHGGALLFNNPLPRVNGFIAAPPVLHTLLLKRRKLPDRASKIHATG